MGLNKNWINKKFNLIPFHLTECVLLKKKITDVKTAERDRTGVKRGGESGSVNKKGQLSCRICIIST